MKPTLSWKSYQILLEIDQYVRSCDCRGIGLVQAPSDVCDGSYDRKELDELIRKRVFKICRNDDPEWKEDDYKASLCSYGWTVDFSPAAIKHFYPERENERPHPVKKRSVPRASVRSRQPQVRNVRGGRTGCSSHNGKKAVRR